MASRAFVPLCLSILAVVTPSEAAKISESSAMFPALRKRKLASAQNVEKSLAQIASPEQKSAEVDKMAQAPKEVPPVADAGADGFPHLPAVSNMLSQAAGTLKSVSSQASGLQARMVQVQMQSEEKVAKHKAAFEEKLKAQEAGNQMVIETNKKISGEINRLNSENSALRKTSSQVQDANRQMRKQLHALQSRLGVGRAFVDKSLLATDDTNSSLLQVLTVSRARRHRRRTLLEVASKREVDNDDDSDDDASAGDTDDSQSGASDEDDTDEESPSFLSLSMKRRVARADNALDSSLNDLQAMAVETQPAEAATDTASSPSDLLGVLAKDVAKLAQQQKEGEKQLKDLFIRDFRNGARRHKALMDQQKSLTTTRNSLLSLQAKLKNAEKHLVGTRSQLEARLRGLGQYLQKMAHFAMAPQKEVPHLLETMPKTIAVKVA